MYEDYDLSIRTSYLILYLNYSFRKTEGSLTQIVIITSFKYSHACLLCVPEENTLMLDWYQDFP